MIFDYAGIKQLLPAAICLQVTSLHAGLPVCNAHIYTRKEKDEVISSGNGHYRLLTWQPLPALLTIEHRHYAAATVIITDNAAPRVIQLQLKP